MRSPRLWLVAVCLVVSGALVLPTVRYLHAQSVEDLQNSIADSTSKIDQIKQEIAKLQTQLNDTRNQKQTLQNAVKTLDLNIKKITANISLTNAQIVQKDAQISKLSKGIATTTNKIGDVRGQVGHTLSELQTLDDEPPVMTLLSGATLSSVFDQIAALDSVRSGLQDKIAQLGNLKDTLQTHKSTEQEKREELAQLQVNLSQQKQSLAIARQSQNDLLIQTKNQESTYQALIGQKKAQQAKFEQDILTYESQLNLKVTPGSLPAVGSAPLRWPLDNVIITQYFGNTPFSTANPQIYNGKGHTGIDFGVPPGTPVKAARGGVVLGSGNTDATCPGASFGKWVFIKHDNGLSTLYAHLASFSVSKGDSVATGQVIGYSDTTGYATGPHLHFGVYASSGSEVASFPSSSCKGKIYTMPVGDVSAYLNPLSYLPKI